MPDTYTLIHYVASAALISLGTLGGLLYTFQTSLIYPANVPGGSRTEVPVPSDFGMPYEDVSLVTPDGVRIKAFLMLQFTAPQSSPTILMLHANAGNVGHRLPIAQVFWGKMHCNVLALSYRGYGHSEGSPSEKGLRLDAQTALDYILSHPKLEKTKIFLYGQSIGSAVAIDLASRNATRLTGLIVENTFLSLPKLVPIIMPFLSPFLFLLHQIWPSDESITKLPPSFPVLFLSGSKDTLIPPEHMKELYRLCSGEKDLVEFENGTHNDTCSQRYYFDNINIFIARALKSEKLAEKGITSYYGKYTSSTGFGTISVQDEMATDTGSFVFVNQPGDTSTDNELEDSEKTPNAGSVASVKKVIKESVKDSIHE